MCSTGAQQVTELLHSFGRPQDAVLDLGGIDTARGTEMPFANRAGPFAILTGEAGGSGR